MIETQARSLRLWGRYYWILEHDDRPLVAVKFGFSYPAFFLTWGWALWNQMFSLVGFVLLISFLPLIPELIAHLVIPGALVHPDAFWGLISRVIVLLFSDIFFPVKLIMALPPLLFVHLGGETTLEFVTKFLFMVIGWCTGVYFGFFGNFLLVSQLKSQGYRKVDGFVLAGSARGAIRRYQSGAGILYRKPSIFWEWSWGILWSLVFLWPYANTAFLSQIWGAYPLPWNTVEKYDHRK